MTLTLRNSKLGTSARIRVQRRPGEIIVRLSPDQVKRVRLKLLPGHLAPPGSHAWFGAGALGEYGPQRPPETPGWEYEVRPHDLGAELIPHEINGRARRGRKARK